MKIKLIFLIILLCGLPHYASRPAQMQKSDGYSVDSGLFNQKYNLIEKALSNIDPNFEEIVQMYQDLRHSAEMDTTKQTVLDYLVQLIRDAAAKYILAHIEQVINNYKNIQVEILKFVSDHEKIEVFTQAGKSLEQAIRAAAIMNEFNSALNRSVYIDFEKQHKLNYVIVNKSMQLARVMNDFFYMLGKMVQETPQLYSFFEKSIEVWQELGNQLVQLKMINGRSLPHAGLKGDVKNEAAAQQLKLAQKLERAKFEEYKKIINQNIEEALLLFKQIAENKPVENARARDRVTQVIAPNLNDRAQKFNNGIDILKATAEILKEMEADKSCSLLANDKLAQQELDQNMCLLEEILTYMELFIDEYRNTIKRINDIKIVKEAYFIKVTSLNIAQSVLDLSLMADNIHSCITPLFQKIFNILKSAEERSFQEQFGELDSLHLKEKYASELELGTAALVSGKLNEQEKDFLKKNSLLMLKERDQKAIDTRKNEILKAVGGGRQAEIRALAQSVQALYAPQARGGATSAKSAFTKSGLPTELKEDKEIIDEISEWLNEAEGDFNNLRINFKDFHTEYKKFEKRFTSGIKNLEQIIELIERINQEYGKEKKSIFWNENQLKRIADIKVLAVSFFDNIEDYVINHMDWDKPYDNFEIMYAQLTGKWNEIISRLNSALNKHFAHYEVRNDLFIKPKAKINVMPPSISVPSSSAISSTLASASSVSSSSSITEQPAASKNNEKILDEISKLLDKAEHEIAFLHVDEDDYHMYYKGQENNFNDGIEYLKEAIKLVGSMDPNYWNLKKREFRKRNQSVFDELNEHIYDFKYDFLNAYIESDYVDELNDFYDKVVEVWGQMVILLDDTFDVQY